MSESQAAIQALIVLSSGRGWYGSAGTDLTCSPLGALTQREMKIEEADEFCEKRGVDPPWNQNLSTALEMLS